MCSLSLLKNLLNHSQKENNLEMESRKKALEAILTLLENSKK
jgi:hypothetical protein